MGGAETLGGGATASADHDRADGNACAARPTANAAANVYSTAAAAAHAAATANVRTAAAAGTAFLRDGGSTHATTTTNARNRNGRSAVPMKISQYINMELYTLCKNMSLRKRTGYTSAK